MSTKAQLGIAALLALALLAFSAAGAGAAEFRQAEFKAEVKGTQTYKGEYHHSPFDSCDPTIDEVATETVKFKSVKPVLLTVTQIPQAKDPILTSGTRSLKFKTKAKVTRAHDIAVGGVPDTCPDNGGGVPNVQEPDCGTKTVTPWVLSVAYYKRNHVELQPTNGNTDDPFQRCGSGRFPFLLSGDRFGKRQDAELPVEEVFDGRIGKLITIGEGNEGIVGPETDDQTDIRWELSLTRIKPKS